MKKFITVFALLLPILSYAANLTMPIVSITDGDTIRSSLKLPCPLCNVSVRILGIDTPESNHLAKCPAEQARGVEAKEFVKSLAAGHLTMSVSGYKWDKYGGRINGYVIINGVDIGKALVNRGLARPYHGRGPKPNWCN